MSVMTYMALPTAQIRHTPTLRLLARRGPTSSPAAQARGVRARRGQPAPRTTPEPSRDSLSVLVAGGDADQRAAVLGDLSETMPDGTTFNEASTCWEVLAQATGNRMVILSGDLDDAPSKSLMQMLGQRHPSLPVVSLAAPGRRQRLDARG